MKQMNKYKNVFSLLLLLFTVIGCAEDKFETFDSERRLYVVKSLEINDATIRVDTADVSFSHLGTATEYLQKFPIALIGNTITSDLEYKVSVVASETTAKADQYKLEDKFVFKKDSIIDFLEVTIFKDKLAKDEEVILVLELLKSDNFGIGYEGYTKMKFRFNNKIIQPLWWTSNVTDAYFGEYSLEKLNLIMEANPGFMTIEGIGVSEIREIALATKDLIAKKGITDMEDL